MRSCRRGDGWGWRVRPGRCLPPLSVAGHGRCGLVPSLFRTLLWARTRSLVSVASRVSCLGLWFRCLLRCVWSLVPVSVPMSTVSGAWYSVSYMCSGFGHSCSFARCLRCHRRSVMARCSRYDVFLDLRWLWVVHSVVVSSTCISVLAV